MTEYVLSERAVDSQTVLRSRRRVTLDTCRICGYCVSTRAGRAPYADQPEEVQREMLEVLEQHRKLAHPREMSAVLNEDEIPSSWLTSDRSLVGSS